MSAVGASSAELARGTGCAERYVGEWLDHHVVAGILKVDDPGVDPTLRSYSLPDAHAEVLLNKESLAYAGALAKAMVVFARAVD